MAKKKPRVLTLSIVVAKEQNVTTTSKNEKRRGKETLILYCVVDRTCQN